MGGPCATGSSTENSGAAGATSRSITTGSLTDSTNAAVSATGSGAISGSITTRSLTDSNDAVVSATGAVVGSSKTDVLGSNATGVQTGSGAAIGVQTGSGAAGSLQTGVSAKKRSSFGAAGISSTL